MMEFKNPIKMFKIGKKMSPPIPLVMRIIILFDWSRESFECFTRPRNYPPKSHRREKSFSILIGLGRMKRPLIQGKDFQPSIGQGEQAQGGVIGDLPKEVIFCVYFLEGEGRK